MATTQVNALEVPEAPQAGAAGAAVAEVAAVAEEFPSPRAPVSAS